MTGSISSTSSGTSIPKSNAIARATSTRTKKKALLDRGGDRSQGLRERGAFGRGADTEDTAALEPMTSGRTYGYTKNKRNGAGIRNVGGARGRSTGDTQRALKSLTGS